MRESKLSDLRRGLERIVQDYGAYAMRVADASKGFEKAISGCRPRDVMENCNSVVAFAIYVGYHYYHTLKIENKIAGDDRIMHIFRDWVQYKAADYLQKSGYYAVVPTGFFNREKWVPRFSSKLAAYEAGLGIYGRCGIIITPEYGPRVNIGVILTDAHLEPDEKLTDFDPCLKCRLCVDLCPPNAIRDNTSAPMSHDRDKCISFVAKLREKTSDHHFYCGYCYDFCPVGKTYRTGFSLSRYRNLLDLDADKRERLITAII